MDVNTLTPFISLIGLLFIGFINWRWTGTLSGRIKGIADVAPHTRHWVLASEQLCVTGKLPREERFAWVYKNVKKSFPMRSKDEITASIEAAVYLLNAGKL